MGELALRPGSDWIEFTVLLGLMKWIPPADERGCAVEHLASPGSQWTPRSHDTAPLCCTCWSDLGQQMFQLHSLPKSMAIDLG